MVEGGVAGDMCGRLLEGLPRGRVVGFVLSCRRVLTRQHEQPASRNRRSSKTYRASRFQRPARTTSAKERVLGPRSVPQADGARK